MSSQTIKDPTKLSSHVTIPKGMYFIPTVHRSLLAYRNLLDIEKYKSPQNAIEFAKNFVKNAKNFETDMKIIYQKALSKHMKKNKQ